jgi:saccharopine dehydrogenase (NAD+, L-lysine-forming)
VTRLRGPDGYTFTVRAALAVVERVLAGDAPPGFQTPSTAYGADFVLGVEGATRDDVS